MISVIAYGRLGNQLFQYSFAYSISKKLGCSFYIDKRYEKYVLNEYFVVSKDIFSILDKRLFSITGFKKFFQTYLKLGLYAMAERRFKLNKINFSDSELPIEQISRIADQKIYHGFFQSEEYFKNYKSSLQHEFKIKNKYILEFEKVFKSIPQNKKLVVVQVRRTDYIDLNISLPLHYYHKIINDTFSDRNFYIIISDDKEFIKDEFAYLENKYISQCAEIIDFQFLMNADVCIIANSTFGWWGAYLNTNKPKIYAPKYWLGFAEKEEFPRGILPMKFEAVEV